MSHREDAIEQAEVQSRLVAEQLKDCLRTMDLTNISYHALMGGITIFALEGMSWCHQQMEPRESALDLVIENFGDALRATVAANDHRQRG